MSRRGLVAGLVLGALAACVPTTPAPYDPWDYDFRYGVYDDYWNGGGGIDRPDRPRPPSGVYPSQPIYYPPGTRPTTLPSRPVASRPAGGYSGAAGGLRGGGGGRGGRR